MNVFRFSRSVLCAAICVSSIAAQHGKDHDRSDYQQVECTIIPIVPSSTEHEGEVHHISHPHIPAPRSLRSSNNFAESTNWSGYVAANKLSSPKKGSVTDVSGSWVVPTLRSTPNHSYCAFWVGIDGFSSSTVEQIGTEHDWNNGAQQNYAWFEMYPGGSYVISGFPLNSGDLISASVEYIGNSTFVMVLHNDTQHVTTTVPTSHTKSSSAQMKSAEWIVEAPYLNEILPLADFVTAYWSNCMATISGITANLKNSSWQNEGIEMITNSGAAKAIPSAIASNDSSFTVTWKHE
jgi:Peptidase A4 family